MSRQPPSCLVLAPHPTILRTMKVHLLQIPADGKHYEGEESNEMLDLHEPDVVPVSPVRYALDVGLSGGGLWAAGKVGADVRLQCGKCLESFVFPAEVP